MSSAEPGRAMPEGASSTGRPPSDGSTRDRIRDVAVLRFASSGFDTSVRSIAADAGVSAALVIHHFGSKDGLHRACDDYVLRWIVGAKRQNMGKATNGQLLQVMAEVDDFAPLLGYAVRSLQAGGEVARAFVQHMIDDAQVYTREAVADGIVKPSLDEDARVRYLTLSALGTLLLSLTLDPPDDPEDFGANVRAFMTRQYLPMIELFTQGFLTSRRMLDDYLLYVGDPPSDGAHPAATDTDTDEEEP
ncbi:TetR/AcrR family transcriptional regulator [Isoptericola halotolerans]|uniref:TetR/AcrR family transcriptional regulator n=1 Tax=Isoptericola halotolerans TaxID=300560 RepID=UPI00388E4D5E